MVWSNGVDCFEVLCSAAGVLRTLYMRYHNSRVASIEEENN